MRYPLLRLRRLRSSKKMRDMLQEVRLSTNDLVMPLFVRPGENVEVPIESMPGQAQLSVDLAAKQAREAQELGIPAVLLFGIPPQKDETASGAYDDEGIIQQATRAIKEAAPEILVIADTCLCEYTSHGHCGMLKGEGENATVDNDATLGLLAKTAVSQAHAGADIVAPSAMMDGQVQAIRSALDREGLEDIAILAYAAKFASSFYGPFRDAAESAPAFGDRTSYQMAPPNANEALREVQLDIEEGADMVMVKPALGYQDIIFRVKERFGYPLACYSVSGEYAMAKAAANAGWLDEKRVVLEMLTGFKRAGADIIITYWAKDAAQWLK